MKEVKLPSGAVLKVSPAPFKDAKALYQALLKEARGIEINSKTEMAEIYKNLFCTGFSSEEVERVLWVCLARCTYNSGKGDLKIDGDTFEPVEARDDYMQVCVEVAKENVLPFVKSLYAEYKRMLSMTENVQA
jgi:hypothetical protein